MRSGKMNSYLKIGALFGAAVAILAYSMIYRGNIKQGQPESKEDLQLELIQNSSGQSKEKMSPALVQLSAVKDEKKSSETRKKVLVYQELSEKVLRTTEEARHYSELLADQELLDEAKEVLLHPDLKRDFSEVQSERLDRVNYLVDSLKKSKDQNRQRVIETMEKIIVTSPAGANLPEPLSRSSVGDRIELFMVLLEREPEKAKDLVKNTSSDAYMQRLYAYAKNYYFHHSPKRKTH